MSTGSDGKIHWSGTADTSPADQIGKQLLQIKNGVNEKTSDSEKLSISASGRYSITKEVEERIVHNANKKAMEIYITQGKKSAGPCLSTIYDPLIDASYKDLDPFYYGQNFKARSETAFIEYKQWIVNEADPIIKKRYLDYKYEVKNGLVNWVDGTDHRLAAHSEIRALDEAIKVRRSLGLPVTEETLNELYVYNIDLRNMYKTGKTGIPAMIPKCRCPNCLILTDGINTIIHE